jgi:hypothetical protein
MIQVIYLMKNRYNVYCQGFSPVRPACGEGNRDGSNSFRQLSMNAETHTSCAHPGYWQINRIPGSSRAKAREIESANYDLMLLHPGGKGEHISSITSPGENEEKRYLIEENTLFFAAFNRVNIASSRFTNKKQPSCKRKTRFVVNNIGFLVNSKWFFVNIRFYFVNYENHLVIYVWCFVDSKDRFVNSRRCLVNVARNR